MPQNTLFLETAKKTTRNLQVISKLPQNQHFNNPIHLSPGGPIPHNMAQTFDGPTTIKRSGSEHRRAVTSSLFGQERGLVRDMDSPCRRDGEVEKSSKGRRRDSKNISFSKYSFVSIIQIFKNSDAKVNT